MACLLSLVVLFGTGVLSAPLQNITLPLPVGTTYHSTPGLLCTPAQWTDILAFYCFNYIAHAATVITRPGERNLDFAGSAFGCLLFPAMGLYRGVEAILGGAVFVGWRKWKWLVGLKQGEGEGDKEVDAELRKAAKSGALCMIVRTKNWRPVDGDNVNHVVLKRDKVDFTTLGSPLSSPSKYDEGVRVVTYQPPWILSKFGCPVYVRRQIIHGSYSLPDGYAFAIVPPTAHFAIPRTITGIPRIEVAATYNMVKALVAIAQTCYASLTLYRSRGDQIQQFGFAAFGLTVAPYAVMSIINLIGNLCRPDYASLYMVESSTMEEAKRRGGFFEGSVGAIEEQGMVCSCQFVDGEDVQDVHFTEGSIGETVASFYTEGLTRNWHRRLVDEKEEKTESMCSSVTGHSLKVLNPPENMDYTSTSGSTLLLVPSCSPLKLSSTSTTEFVAPTTRWSIKSVQLRKLWACSNVHTYRITFQPTSHDRHAKHYRILKYLITFSISLIPLLLNGLMSHFKSGEVPPAESNVWRSYTMQWLAFGVAQGLWFVFDQERQDGIEGTYGWWWGPKIRIVWYMLSANPALGGFVAVGQMLERYGACTWVGN